MVMSNQNTSLGLEWKNISWTQNQNNIKIEQWKKQLVVYIGIWNKM